MNGVMAEKSAAGGSDKPRTRLIIDTDDDLITALSLRAAKESVRRRGEKVSKSDMVNTILREVLKPELNELELAPETQRKHSRRPKEGK